MSRIRIVLDAMGGDFAPGNPVKGALEALDRLPVDVDIILVGRSDSINAALTQHKYDGGRILVHNADEVIPMETHDVNQILAYRDSSIQVGIDMLRSEDGHGFVSAGNTGAVNTWAFRKRGRIRGVDRLALAATFPSLSGPCLMLDVGATPDCTPINIVHNAVMGEVYAKYVLGVPHPKVALMNVGEEPTKGDRLRIEAFKLLETMKVNGTEFIGNVEGRDIFSGRAQVIVFDGFTGNVMLKFAESIMPTLKALISHQLNNGRWDQKIFAGLAGNVFLGPTIGALKHTLDVDVYGGAPLLGVNGTVIVAHGRSSPSAIASAIVHAQQAVRNRVIDTISSHLETIQLTQYKTPVNA